jgi:dsRNA-specific ribonuclease
VELPAFEAAVAPGGRRRVEVAIELDGRSYTSGPHEAGSSRLAEQLAARALLAALVEAESAEDAREVDDEVSLRLKRDNPKGRLLERCMSEGLPFPEFPVRPLPAGGFAGTARLRLGERETVESGRFRAAAAKAVEQAASEDLLERLKDRTPVADSEGGGATEGGAGAESGATAADPAPGPDPRLLLNRYKQTGQLVDFGYELVETRGPAHLPEFVLRGWVETRDGQRLFSDAVTATNKKEAQRRAAEAIVSLLRS